MRHNWLLLALTLTGCAEEPYDRSTTINLAPSADVFAERVIAASQQLNLAVGRDLFTVRAVGSEAFIDGEVVVVLKSDAAHTRVRSTTRVTDHGVHIALHPESSVALVMHELVHAAGLHAHHNKRGNLMYESVGGTELTQEQIATILEPYPE